MSKLFARFSEQALGSEMYQFLSKEMASDSELMALAAKAEQSQPVPNLFLAAVNFLLYKDPTLPLSRFYPNHSGRPFSKNGLFEAFKEFCLQHSDALIHLMQTRLVQTNEVRRCALLLPAVAWVADITRSDIALVDVGTSSGLNLFMDQYRYQYSDGTAIGDPKAPLQISCTVKSGKLKLKQMPKIEKRLGIDLNPIDLNDQDEMLWTLSLVWPDQPERIARLKAAIQTLKRNSAEVHRGDAVQLLPAVVETIPSRWSLCVMHSFAFNQFPAEAKLDFEKALCSISNERDVWRIGLEWIDTELPELSLSHYTSGRLAEKKILANCHFHGEWIEWIA